MLIVGERLQTLPEVIACDPSTGLPLLGERDAVMKIVLAYQALPYSMAEYGCGKKASLIINQLIRKGLPTWAFKRMLCIEHDMSPDALTQLDQRRRPHAITVANPLHDLAEVDNPVLDGLLHSVGARFSDDRRFIDVGPFRLSLEPEIQFVHSRSHLCAILTLWDDEQQTAVDLAIDPTLDIEAPFDPCRMRHYLNAPQAWICTAPMLGQFSLDPKFLTPEQQEQIRQELGSEQSLGNLSQSAHNTLFRKLTGAQRNTIGDPATWTYANNWHGSDEDHTERQLTQTGRGDALREAVNDMLRARVEHDPEVAAKRRDVETLVRFAHVRETLREDAAWSEDQLEPLAEVALTVVYHRSLEALAETLRNGGSLQPYLADEAAHMPLRGLGARLRRRIDRLAAVSCNERGEIDARALNRWFRHAAIETAKQMNRAGLSVFVDRVGNIHGVQLDREERSALRDGQTTLRKLMSDAISHASHIDTVGDGGKFDGRLGVAAGIETAHVIHDLKRYYDVTLRPEDSPVRLLVTGYCNEEMTFTGEQVSMPGSAAVASQAASERIHRMTDGDANRYGDGVVALLGALRDAAQEGHIELMNRLDGDGEALLAGASDPADFFTPHHFERHIEQGPVLDRENVPIVMVNTIMGIHQEDFTFDGPQAEMAALEFGVQLRDLIDDGGFGETRITVGIMKPLGELKTHTTPAAAFHCEILGERNHAGSIAMADRRDPGVAAGRLARGLEDWAAEHGGRPLVGDLQLLPGLNRNVIPGTARLTLGIDGDTLNDEQAAGLRERLQTFAAQSLLSESSQICRLEPASFVNIASRVRLSIDLRAPTSQLMDEFRGRIDEVIAGLRERLGVEVTADPQQRLEPSPIEDSGQVLLMERSYGGSHNPHENELTPDLTRGCILQLMVTQDVLSRPDLNGVNLFRCTESHLPQRWLDTRSRFVSGALHDTCNISARARELLRETTQAQSGVSRRAATKG